MPRFFNAAAVAEAPDLSLAMVQSAEFRDQVKNNLAAEVLQNSGKVCLAAFGNSMLPSIWPGDLLAIEARSFEQISPGEVILFARDGRFFIHRVLQKADTASAQHLITRGDAMPQIDEPVLPQQVLGKAISVRRRGRDVPVPPYSSGRRLLGLMFAFSGRMRSLALRVRACNAPAQGSEANIAPAEVSLQ